MVCLSYLELGPTSEPEPGVESHRVSLGNPASWTQKHVAVELADQVEVAHFALLPRGSRGKLKCGSSWWIDGFGCNAPA